MLGSRHQVTSEEFGPDADLDTHMEACEEHHDTEWCKMYIAYQNRLKMPTKPEGWWWSSLGMPWGVARGVLFRKSIEE